MFPFYKLAAIGICFSAPAIYLTGLNRACFVFILHYFLHTFKAQNQPYRRQPRQRRGLEPMKAQGKQTAITPKFGGASFHPAGWYYESRNQL